MTAILVNPSPTTPPVLTLASFIEPGEYVDEGGPTPSDAPEAVSGWHLIVENPQQSVLTKQTFAVAPAAGSESAPFPGPTLYVRYIMAFGSVPGGKTTNATSWQQVPA